MDVQTGLVYVGVVVLSAAVILLVSMFGIKETSYEEAIAEQRKLPDDLLLSKKDKSKEKKHKNKTGKKVKEKKDEKEEKEEKPDHVQFEETPQILPPEPPVVQEGGKGTNNKKKNKVEKVKPILVNKDEPVAVVQDPSPSQTLVAEANHFDVIHPKDDLELIRSHSKENLSQMSQSEPLINKSPKETPTKSKKAAKEVAAKRKDDAKEENAPVQVAKELKEQQPKEVANKEPKESSKESVTSVQSATKETKKTKKKGDILSQIGGDKDGVNVSLLVHLIHKAELSRSEIQILIDQLLNKQLDNPAEHSEWTEGRADPVIKLKKQLAEKEKALADEHEASVAFQNKLKELRAELTSEKTRLNGMIRQLEETLSNKVTDVQTLHTRMQHILESHAAEKQGFARQIEQLQAKVDEDAAIIHKMQEDQGQTQGHLQQELINQRKQMEVQFAQFRDNENALKTQLAQKHGELQEIQSANISISQELQATCENTSAEIDMLRQQLAIMQEQLMHSEGQLQHYKEAGDRLSEMARQLEESHRAHADLDHRLKSAHRHEQELQKQIGSLQAELNLVKPEASEAVNLKAEVNKLQSEIAELRKLEAVLGEFRMKFEKSQEELRRAQNDLSRISQLENEIKSLKSENESLASQLTATTERPAAEGRENGIEEKLQKNSVDLVEHANLLAQRETQIDALRTELTLKEAEINQLNAQVEALRSDINNQHNIVRRLQDDLESQRSKNNELRIKNWKVMEALTAAELRVKSNSGKSLDEVVQKVRSEEQESTKAFLQRIFPEIKITEKSYDRWVSEFEERIGPVLKDLKQSSDTTDANPELEKQNKNLQGMVSHYKYIIDETEGMLNKLQSHVEEEETRWQKQLQQKESEVSSLRLELEQLRNSSSSSNEKLQQTISELEGRLREAESLREQAKAELAAIKATQKPCPAKEANSHDLIASEKMMASEILGGSSSEPSVLNGPPSSTTSNSEGGSGRK